MIKLVPVCVEKASEMVEAVIESLPDLEPWMPWASPDYSLATALHWINDIASTGYEFHVLGANGEFIGNVGINSIRPDNKIANLGYWVRRSAKGQGYATEAVKDLVCWVRNNTDLNRLEIVAAEGNVASRRVAEKSGAFYEGVAKARILLHGQFHDAAIYSFTNDKVEING